MANMSATIDEELLTKLEKEADDNERTLSAQLRVILKERYEKKK